MRTEMQAVRIGEYLGPVDWAYDFSQHNWSEGKGGINPGHAQRSKEWLTQLEAEPDAYIATTDGGWPKVGWQRVVRVGMYDGWPFWKPTPSVQLAGPLGTEWHPWYSISAIEREERARREG
jgi:hypothetical protein